MSRPTGKDGQDIRAGFFGDEGRDPFSELEVRDKAGGVLIWVRKAGSLVLSRVPSRWREDIFG